MNNENNDRTPQIDFQTPDIGNEAPVSDNKTPVSDNHTPANDLKLSNNNSDDLISRKKQKVPMAPSKKYRKNLDIGPIQTSFGFHPNNEVIGAPSKIPEKPQGPLTNSNKNDDISFKNFLINLRIL